MSYTATWGPMGFVVSPTKIVPFKDLSTSVEVKAGSTTSTSGGSQTNVRGRELQSMSFSATYIRAAGVDPRAKYEQWESLLGKVHPLYIGGKRFGPAKMMLKSISISDLLLSNNGDFLRVTVSVNLEEEKVSKPKPKETTPAVVSGIGASRVERERIVNSKVTEVSI